MDVRVVDAEGRFVRDLTKDDFQVEEDGQPQAISTFELVDIPFESSEGPTFAGKPIDLDVATNEDSEGRLYMIVLDDLGMHPLRSGTVRALGREFIETRVSPRDRVALTTTSGRKDMTLEFTNDRARVLETIDKFQGGFGLGKPLDELKALADWMAPIDGRRKTVVLISQGLNSGLPDLRTATGHPTIDFSTPAGTPTRHGLDYLLDLRHVQPAIDRRVRPERRDRRGRTQQRQLLHDRSGRPSGIPVPGREARAVPVFRRRRHSGRFAVRPHDGPGHARLPGRGDRRRVARPLEQFHRRLRPHRRGLEHVLPARVLEHGEARRQVSPHLRAGRAPASTSARAPAMSPQR